MLQCLVLATSAVRWQFCLRVSNVSSPLRKTLKIYFATNFLGTALPAGIGQDVLRIYAVARSGGAEARRMAKATASVVIDRIFGLGAFAIVATPALLAYSRLIELPTGCVIPVNWDALSYYAWSAGLVSAVLAAMLLQLITTRQDLVRPLQRAFSAAAEQSVDYAIISCLSILIVFLVVIVVCVLGMSITPATPFSEYLLAVPLIALLAQLPLSILGLGVREVGFVLLFACSTASREEALALSIVYFAVGLLANLLCGVFYFGSFSKDDARHVE